jgi:uncharacterized membrane protein
VGDQSPEVFVAVFDDEARAERAHRALSAVEAEGLIALLAVAVITRDPEGRAGCSIRGPEPGRLSARADTIATMLGVLLPAPVLLAGLTASVDDGRAGRDAQRDFADGFAAGLAEAVPPGGAVFIAAIDDRWVTEVDRGLRGYHRLTRQGA